MNPTAELIQPEVLELIREGAFSELRAALKGIPPADIADIVGDLAPADAAVLFRFLPRDDAGSVFSYLNADHQQTLITELGASAVRVVEGMDPDDQVRLLEELPPQVAQRLIASLKPEERREVQVILGYPTKSVGRLMTPDYVRVMPEWTIAQALDHIRKTGRDAETINVVYVTDDRGKLIDDIRLRQLVMADPEKTVESIMNRNFVALSADQHQEEAVRMLQRYDRVALPVVDSREILLGIVTHDDVADVATQEATEDIQKLGGMQALEEPYMRVGHVAMYRKRGSWLSVLFIGQSITILVLGSFQDQIEKAAVLSVFMPLVISCGGNSGSQAATLVTRALALGEVTPTDWWHIVRRELVSAALLAATLGLLGLLCVCFFTLILKHPHTRFPMELGLTVAGSISAVVLWGTVLGSLLPLLLRRLRLDPAAASSPMVATLMDASGTLIYLGTAIAILTGTIL